MMRWGVIALFLLISQAVSASNAHISQYILTQQRIADNQTTLCLINRATGQTIWKKQAANLDCVGWSSDHKALALSIYLGSDYTAGKTPFRLLIWQEGKPIHLLDDSFMPVESGGGFIDGVIDIVWSPDNRRVLYRVWQSGSKTVNNGLLYCLDTKSWHLSSVPYEVRHMQWLGANRVRYQVINYVDPGNGNRVIEKKHLRFWNFK